MTKKCSRCNLDKPKSEFYVKIYGLNSWCIPCCSKYSKEYNSKNREHLRELNYKYKLRKHYGIDYEIYLDLLERQKGHCALCPSTGSNFKGYNKLSVDHCHQTGKVRGLLCSPCNHGIGHFNDDPSLLRKAANYLEVNY